MAFRASSCCFLPDGSTVERQRIKKTWPQDYNFKVSSGESIFADVVSKLAERGWKSAGIMEDQARAYGVKPASEPPRRLGGAGRILVDRC